MSLLSGIPQPAILLLGPTGSGKTPLGAILQERGWRGVPCLHFDFGANLREIVAGGAADEWIGPPEIEFLRGVLESGALLEDEHFPLAQRILQRFVSRHHADPATWIVLNGLPRHAGQAESLRSLVEVRVVIELVCSAETVAERIRRNTGGDRAARQDDDPAAIARKLDLYHRRTGPLVDYYQGRHTPIETIEVGANMTAGDVWAILQRGGRATASS